MQYEPSFQCIEQYLERNAGTHPENAAVIVRDVRVSYKELWRLTRGFARYLTEECAVSPGERVVVRSAQTLEYAVAYFSVHLPPENAKAIIAETEA